MITDILQLYQDYNVDHKTEGHKHCRPGWVNTPCPFCLSEPGHEGYHLGATLNGQIFYCWRCGWHPPVETISKLLNIQKTEASRLLRQYLGITTKSKETIIKIRSKAHKYPSDTGPLQIPHIKYLESRNFDPKQLVKDWNLLGTGPTSFLEKLNYSRRILAPIYWKGEEVTYQARDITERHILKYMACPEERELMKHKHIIYGKQEKWTKTGICVEGITDVWRLGFSAFATLGIEYTHQQVRLIANTFKQVFVIYDDERQAQAQAKQLVADLRFRSVDAHQVKIIGDPGEMDQKEANYLIKHLIGK